MVCGAVDPQFVSCATVKFGKFYFKIVKAFKYLGLHFDYIASSKYMIREILVRASKSFFWLVKFVNAQAWNTPYTRLVLLNVYVRTLL